MVRKNLFKMFFLFSLIRLPLLLVIIYTQEFSAADVMIQAKDLVGIYDLYFYYFQGPYPPLFYYSVFAIFYVDLIIFQPLEVIFMAPSIYLSMKFYFFLFDLGSFYFFYKIGKLLIKSQKKRKLAYYLYISCPFLFILTGLRGIGEVITLFFILSSYYFLIKKNYLLASLMLTLGILYGIFPILFLLPFFLYLMNKREYFLKSIFSFIIIFTSVFLIVSIPFIIRFPEFYLENLVSIINRNEYTIGYYPVLPQFLNSPLFTLKIANFSIIFTIYRIFQLMIILFLIAFFSLKYKINSFRKLNSFICIFLMISPILMRSFHFRLMFWLAPFFLFYIFDSNHIDHWNHVSDSFQNFLNKKFKPEIFIFICVSFIILSSYLFFYLYDPDFSFSIIFFSVVLLILCVIWGFFLIFQNLLDVLLLEIDILYFTLYYNLYIYLGKRDIFSLYFLSLYHILIFLFIYNIMKNWIKSKELGIID